MFPNHRKRPCRNFKLDVPVVLTFSGDSSCLEKDDGSNDTGENFNVKLVETAIKFFLFQRGQIPVPFEKIQRRVPSLVEDFSEIEVKDFSMDKEDATKLSNWRNEDEFHGIGELSLKERQKLLKMKRKKNFENRKRIKILKKIVQKEENVLNIWEPIFEILRTIPSASMSVREEAVTACTTEAVVLLFGSSIWNPKEVIILEFLNWNMKQFEGIPGKFSTSDDFIVMTRNFYKSVIMSPSFTEFTDKPLRSTYSHLCVLKTNCSALSMENSGPPMNLTLLENTSHILKIIRESEQVNVRRQILHIRLNSIGQYSSSLTSADQIQVKSIFDLNENEIMCYQVPLRFKGISVL